MGRLSGRGPCEPQAAGRSRRLPSVYTSFTPPLHLIYTSWPPDGVVGFRHLAARLHLLHTSCTPHGHRRLLSVGTSFAPRLHLSFTPRLHLIYFSFTPALPRMAAGRSLHCWDWLSRVTVDPVGRCARASPVYTSLRTYTRCGRSLRNAEAVPSRRGAGVRSPPSPIQTRTSNSLNSRGSLIDERG